VNKTILIAPFESSAARAFAEAARAAGWTVVLARSSGEEAEGRAAGRKQTAGKQARGTAGPQGAGSAVQAAAAADAGGAVEKQGVEAQGRAGSTVLSWNPSSYISTTALLLAAQNAVGPLGAAVIFEGGQTVDLLSSAPGSIEAEICAGCLGPSFLARGLIRQFEEQKSGSLLLYQKEIPPETPRGPAAALEAAAFRGLGDGLFEQGRGAGWQVFGILDSGGSEAEAARFAFRLLEDGKGGKTGRWLRFNGKSGIFGIF